MKFAFIAAEKATWPVAWMCRKLGVSRSAAASTRPRVEGNALARSRTVDSAYSSQLLMRQVGAPTAAHAFTGSSETCTVCVSAATA